MESVNIKISNFIRNRIFDYIPQKKFTEVQVITKNSQVFEYILNKKLDSEEKYTQQNGAGLKYKKELIGNIQNDKHNKYKKFLCLRTQDGNHIGIFLKNDSILIYHFLLGKVTIAAEKAHNTEILTFSHIIDKEERSDFLLTIAVKGVKLWKIVDSQLVMIVKLKDSIEDYSHSLLLQNKNIVVYDEDNIKFYVYDFEGKEVNSKVSSGYIPSVKNTQLVARENSFLIYSSTYLLVVDLPGLEVTKEYNFNTHLHSLSDDKNEIIHINSSKEMVRMNINTGHSQEIKTDIKYDQSTHILPWNETCFYVTNKKGSIMYYVNNKISKMFSKANKEAYQVQKFIHPFLGACLVVLETSGKAYLWFS